MTEASCIIHGYEKQIHMDVKDRRGKIISFKNPSAGPCQCLDTCGCCPGLSSHKNVKHSHFPCQEFNQPTPKDPLCKAGKRPSFPFLVICLKILHTGRKHTSTIRHHAKGPPSA